MIAPVHVHCFSITFVMYNRWMPVNKDTGPSFTKLFYSMSYLML